MTGPRVAVCGAAGRMGRMIVRAAVDTPGVRLGAALTSARGTGLGIDAGVIAGVAPTGVLIVSDVAAALDAVDVAIDFTSPSGTTALAMAAAARGVALVIGTTGLDRTGEAAVAEAARRVPVVRSANMSLGVNVLLGLLGRVAEALRDYDVEIVELHHRMKQDAPSGTALLLERAVAATRNLDSEAARRTGRSGQIGPRTAGEIGVLALRGGDVVGEHTVFFLGPGERVELTHRATSREIFARGALRAAQWVHGRPLGLYDMLDVLGLR